MQEIEECSCCRYPAIGMKEYGPNATGDARTMRLLCDICATTFISNLVEYPRVYSHESQHLGTAIAYIGNMLRDEIRKLKSE